MKIVCDTFLWKLVLVSSAISRQLKSDFRRFILNCTMYGTHTEIALFLRSSKVAYHTNLLYIEL